MQLCWRRLDMRMCRSVGDAVCPWAEILESDAMGSLASEDWEATGKGDGCCNALRPTQTGDRQSDAFERSDQYAVRRYHILGRPIYHAVTSHTQRPFRDRPHFDGR